MPSAARGVVISRRQLALPVRRNLYRVPRESAVREVFRRYGKKTMILGVQMRSIIMSLCSYLYESMNCLLYLSCNSHVDFDDWSKD
jgi:hypothetical protein